MRLIMETLGVLVAAVIVARAAFGPLGARGHTLAAAVVAAAVAAPLAFASIDTQLRSLADNRKAVEQQRKQGVTQHDIENFFGQRTGVATGFTDAALQRMKGRESYYLVMPTGPEGAGLAAWITWRMLPHLVTGLEGQRGDGVVEPPSLRTAQKADWILFYRVDPRRWALRRGVKLRHVERLAPGFALGRR